MLFQSGHEPGLVSGSSKRCVTKKKKTDPAIPIQNSRNEKTISKSDFSHAVHIIPQQRTSEIPCNRRLGLDYYLNR